MTPPETRYAKADDSTHIAYQILGDGPFDLLWVPGYVSHIESDWEEPRTARFLNRIASFCRLIRFDKRGTGLSDRTGDQHLEQWVDDTLAVMEAAGSSRAALFGISGGGPMAMLFAALYPERTSALVIYESYARALWADDYPFGLEPEALQQMRDLMVSQWGHDIDFERWAPSVKDDVRLQAYYSKKWRLAASPGAVASVLKTLHQLDVRHVLPAISVPSLVLHNVGSRIVPVAAGQYLGKHIPGAKYVELPGQDHLPYFEHPDLIIGEMQEFLTGSRSVPDADRILATVLFTDIVGSTERAAALGDRRWRETLDEYDAVVGRELERFRGRQIKTTGDGTLATFDGPARAVRCACAIRDTVRRLGLELRSGLHAGEVEVRGDDVTGLAVVIGQRVSALAGAGEVLASSTVKDLVVGSGVVFAESGEHELKGVPGTWRLFAVEE
jgi:class 3 adenylate cyclase